MWGVDVLDLCVGVHKVFDVWFVWTMWLAFVEA